jgi:DNA-binding MarR family transcriptional regulator
MGTHTSPRRSNGNDDVRRVLDAVRRIVRVLRLSATAAEHKLGISGAQLFILHKLGDGASISVNELAARTHTHQSSVSVVVQRLVDRGLVRRQRSRVDARRVDLMITPAGLRKLRIAPEAAQDRLIQSLQRMRPSDRQKLAALLNQFVDGADAAKPAVLGLFFEDDTKACKNRKVTKRDNV